MSPEISERVRWAVGLLDVQPSDHVLEVGAGTGASASIICAQLGSGRLDSLDRSVAATRRIAEPNQHHQVAGRLRVLSGSLADFVAPQPYDKFLCVNVNAFWTSPATAEVHVLLRSIAPGGCLVIAYGGDAPTGKQDRIAAAVTEALSSAGFAAVRVMTGSAAFAVVARRL